MEPGVRKYLLRIVNTLSWGLLWLAVNSTAGIMYGLAFFEGKIGFKNIAYYVFFLLSLTLFLRYVIRKWSEPIDFNEQ